MLIVLVLDVAWIHTAADPLADDEPVEIAHRPCFARLQVMVISHDLCDSQIGVVCCMMVLLALLLSCLSSIKYNNSLTSRRGSCPEPAICSPLT